MHIINNVPHICPYVIAVFDVPWKRKVESKKAFTYIAVVIPASALKRRRYDIYLVFSDIDKSGNNKKNR